MLYLERLDLRSPAEWEDSVALFSAYLAEMCDDEEYQENIADLHDEELNRQLIEQSCQQHPYFIMRILWNRQPAGLISYSCLEDSRNAFIINFYVLPTYRRSGIGSAAYQRTEQHLRSLGASMIELIPVEKARRFYLRHGFHPVRTTSDGEEIDGKPLACHSQEAT